MLRQLLSFLKILGCSRCHFEIEQVKQIFLPENGIRLEPWQIINHFPNHYELTRKVREQAAPEAKGVVLDPEIFELYLNL